MKKLFLTIIALIGMLIIVALIAPYFISADKLKGPLLAKIEAATGRHVTVDGKFQLRFFPIAGLTMEGVTMTNPPDYGDTKPLMALKSLDVDVAVIPLLGGNIEIKKLVLEEPQVNLRVTKAGIKNWQPPQRAAQASGSLSTAGSAKSSSSVPLQNLMLNDVKMTDGAVAYDDESTGQKWNFQKMNATLSLSGVASPFNVDASGEWNGKKITIKGTLATLQSFLNQERTKIDAAIDSELLSANMSGTIQNSVYSGKADVKSSSLKSLMVWVNPSPAPVHAQGSLALNISSDVECAAKSCALSNASLTLDKIQAKGNIKANWEKKPQIDANLTAGVLDFNPFMSEHAAASSLLFSDAYAETGSHWSDAPMDFGALNAVNGTANIVADGIVINKITIGKTALKAKLDNGHLNADVIDAVMYGGKGNVTLNVDAAGPMPTFEKKASLKDVQVQPLFKDALNLSRLSGTADIDMNSVSRGKSEKELLDNLSGNGQFALNNGSIEGVDLASIALKKSGGAEKTPINAMKGTFTIAQGVVSNKDLVMEMPTLHVSGQGDINLAAYTINYHLAPQVVQAASQQGAAAKQGVAVPVIIEGSLDKPSIHPDLNAAVQNALKNPQEFKQQLKNTRESLKDQLKSPNGVKNLKNLLQGF